MTSSPQCCFGYRIRPREGGWAWATYDPAGEVREQGWAPAKALAAACVIRALAAAAAPQAARAPA